MAGTFKFPEFLTEEERRALNKLRDKLGGKTVYIPHREEDHYHQNIERRNKKIQTMFRRYKKLEMKNMEIYSVISARLTCAKGLSVASIRAIVHGYRKKKGN